jgi:hypothetical protein
MNWIKITDRLPEFNITVLVSFMGTHTPHTTLLVNDSDYGTVWCDFEDYDKLNDADIWMELPKLPILQK